MSRPLQPGRRERADHLELVGAPRVELGSSAGASDAIRSSHHGDVTVVAGAGELDDVAEDLDQAVLVALAEDPLAVICDLTAVTGGSDASLKTLVATSGAHVRDWPAVPLAVLPPTPALARRLRRQPMSEHVLVPATLEQALTEVGRRTRPTTVHLDLAPHPAASRHARDFVSRTCLDWGLNHELGSATLVVSELVTNGVLHAVTDLRLSVARHDGSLRLALRDRSTTAPRPRTVVHDGVHGRGLLLVEAFSRAWGVLPTGDGGKVVWAVLDV